LAASGYGNAWQQRIYKDWGEFLVKHLTGVMHAV
jgi:hypothetical protein